MPNFKCKHGTFHIFFDQQKKDANESTIFWRFFKKDICSCLNSHGKHVCKMCKAKNYGFKACKRPSSSGIRGIIFQTKW